MDNIRFLKQFTSGESKLGIIGLGYVGLPLAEAFAAAGIKVLGFEIDAEKVAAINRGESYVKDVSSESVRHLVTRGVLEATADFDRLTECGAISICVPTPLSKSKSPDVSYIENAVGEIAARLQEGQLVVLESTTYPGTTEELVLPMLETSGLKVGKDFFLAFSPERVDPGNQKYTVTNTPKIIGGVTKTCTNLASSLYGKALDHVHTVNGTMAAEMVKLLENTYRAVNIGFINEFAMMCERLGVDVWEIIEAASTKPFGFQPFYPGPGLGGHCIPIDPLYLSWKMHNLDYKALFIDLADTINSQMPYFVVNRVMEQLNDAGLPLKGSKLLMLGMAYKEDIDDVRESPALDVASILLRKGAVVEYHDPHVKSCAVDGQELTSVDLNAERVAASDLVLIITAHKRIDYQWVVDTAQRVFDAKNATGSLDTMDKVWRL